MYLIETKVFQILDYISLAVLIFTDELTRSNPHSHVKKSRPDLFCVSCRYVSFSLVMVHLKFIFQPVWSGSFLYFPEFISVFPREQYPHPEQWGISLSVVAHLRGMNPGHFTDILLVLSLKASTLHMLQTSVCVSVRQVSHSID